MILVFGVGLLLIWKERKWKTEVGLYIASFFGVILIACLISLITYPMEVKADFNKFLATKAAVEAARRDGVSIENAAIQHKIIESNR